MNHVFPDGFVQGGPQRRANPFQGGRADRFAVTGVALGHTREHPHDVPPRQPAKRDQAEIRDQEQPDVITIGLVRGRPSAAQPPTTSSAAIGRRYSTPSPALPPATERYRGRPAVLPRPWGSRHGAVAAAVRTRPFLDGEIPTAMGRIGQPGAAVSQPLACHRFGAATTPIHHVTILNACHRHSLPHLGHVR